jgi:DNA-binding helix-hairpin-helix protein with protein kinase domain
MSQAFDESGQLIQLGTKLGEGGEGVVFDATHAGQSVAAKIYSKALPPEHQAKLRTMSQIGDTYLKEIAAWPISVLMQKRSGPVAGFTMPKFSGYEPVHELYGVSSRRQTFPKADFAFLVGAGRNLAAAFDAVHAHGHAIGDVNENNIIVSNQAMVKLLDCDSFQVNFDRSSYPCTVGVPHYTPPELQGLNSFHGVTRTANHDNFGLAVMLFQLLFMARHPFSGVPKVPGDLPLEKSIKEFRFAYGADRLARLNDTPPNALQLDYLPPNFGDLFWRAFTEVGAKHGRPKAREWVAALDGLHKSLRSCSSEPQHKYPAHLSRCIWCERDRLGTSFFTPSLAGAAPINLQFNGADIFAVWSQILTLGSLPPLPAYTRATLQATARPVPASVGQSRTKIRLSYGAICLIAFFLALSVPTLWWIWLAGGAVAIHAMAPASSKELQARQAAMRDAKNVYDNALAAYESLRSDRQLADESRDVGMVKTQLDGLPQLLAKEMQQLRSSLVARQLHAFLDQHLIRRARISGIGDQRKQTLASFGVQSAADVTSKAISVIPGFGPSLTKTMLDWRRSIEHRFVPAANAAPTPQDISAVHAKVASMKSKLEQQLRDGAAQLQTVRNEVLAKQSYAKGALEAAVAALSQAEADLAVMQTA